MHRFGSCKQNLEPEARGLPNPGPGFRVRTTLKSYLEHGNSQSITLSGCVGPRTAVEVVRMSG